MTFYIIFWQTIIFNYSSAWLSHYIFCGLGLFLSLYCILSTLQYLWDIELLGNFYYTTIVNKIFTKLKL